MLVSKYPVLSDADLKLENLIFAGDERLFPGWEESANKAWQHFLFYFRLTPFNIASDVYLPVITS